LQLLARVAERSPTTARILLTGYPDAPLFEQCMQYGVHRFFTKPWDDDELRGCVLKFVQERTLPV
jgi:YesN/AraC family two-component response regulator